MTLTGMGYACTISSRSILIVRRPSRVVGSHYVIIIVSATITFKTPQLHAIRITKTPIVIINPKSTVTVAKFLRPT